MMHKYLNYLTFSGASVVSASGAAVESLEGKLHSRGRGGSGWERPIAWNLLAAGKREVRMQGFVHDEASRGYGVFHGGDVGDDAALRAATVHDARLHLHRKAFAKMTLPF
ncbi:shikimate kinase 2 [Striga asiatica]|uniref:Shikimate kinase 2 n=1 Tax=Striga asiatica TaxID=4170 RepID=A0A5A7PGT4_STRAF|nr:shikimate kinase 2 [Striga asiatica]